MPIEKDGTISMLVTDPESGVTSIGTNEGLTEVDDADLVKDGDQVVGVNGYQTLNLGTMAGNPDYDKQWKALQVPFDEDAGTYLRSKSITQASLAKAGFVYDEDQDAMVSTTEEGVVYPADETQGQLRQQRHRRAAAAGLARQRRIRQLHQAAHRRDVALAVPSDHGLDLLLRHRHDLPQLLARA